MCFEAPILRKNCNSTFNYSVLCFQVSSPNMRDDLRARMILISFEKLEVSYEINFEINRYTDK